MSDQLHGMLLWLAVLWPLLLSIPALHERLARPHQLALLPGLLLVLWPGSASLHIAWLLFGTGLALDGTLRWLLASVLLVWWLAAQRLLAEQQEPNRHHATSFFMLTLAGNMGAVLASDMVGFLVFSSFMGYGLYGWLMSGSERLRAACRLYVMALVVADLALFEALLLAAFRVDDLRFAVAAEAMGDSDSAALYVAMVLVAVALRAGIWPLHLWQWQLFGGAALSRALLLIPVPLAMGWLAALRWLPLGSDLQGSGWWLPGLGLTGMLYGLLGFLLRPRRRLLAAWGSVVISGGVLLLLGVGLARADLWQQYGYLGHGVVALLVIVLAALSLVAAGFRSLSDDPEALRPIPGAAWLASLGAWLDSLLRRMPLSPLLLSERLLRSRQRLLRWPASAPAGSWPLLIAIFVLLGLLLAWLASR